jgi:hypothetical protein
MATRGAPCKHKVKEKEVKLILIGMPHSVHADRYLIVSGPTEMNLLQPVR